MFLLPPIHSHEEPIFPETPSFQSKISVMGDKKVGMRMLNQRKQKPKAKVLCCWQEVVVYPISVVMIVEERKIARSQTQTTSREKSKRKS